MARTDHAPSPIRSLAPMAAWTSKARRSAIFWAWAGETSRASKPATISGLLSISVRAGDELDDDVTGVGRVVAKGRKVDAVGVDFDVDGFVIASTANVVSWMW